MACIAAMYVVYTLAYSYRYISVHSDSAVSPPVTCVDTATVHLHSQCSGDCSDVQETAEVQS